MANYKVIYRDSNPKWQVGCPIMFEALQVARNTDTGECYLQLKARNISGRPLSIIKFYIEITPKHDEIESLNLTYLDADINAGSDFKPKPVLLKCHEISSVEASVVQAGDQRSFGKPTKLQAQPKISFSNELTNIRRELLITSGSTRCDAHFIYEENDNWWRCTCGQLNLERNCCLLCNARKKDLQGIDDIERLKTALWDKATSLERNGKLREAVQLFQALAEYKDVETHIEACKKALEEKERKHRLGIALFAVIILLGAVCAIGAVHVSSYFKEQETAQQEEQAAQQREAILAENRQTALPQVEFSIYKDRNSGNGIDVDKSTIGECVWVRCFGYSESGKEMSLIVRGDNPKGKIILSETVACDNEWHSFKLPIKKRLYADASIGEKKNSALMRLR